MTAMHKTVLQTVLFFKLLEIVFSISHRPRIILNEVSNGMSMQLVTIRIWLYLSCNLFIANFANLNLQSP